MQEIVMHPLVDWLIWPPNDPACQDRLIEVSIHLH